MLTDEERAWFDKCPKAVLFEIARQFAMRVADDFTEEAGFNTMKQEWEILHQQQIVPQKPFTYKPPKPAAPGDSRPTWAKMGYASHEECIAALTGKKR